ncbi:MAG: hypothetical protein JNL01_07040 [Bdellovibrionales bacterium]|nr:hypothetical protein [Bdellovibrionales bacterium]
MKKKILSSLVLASSAFGVTLIALAQTPAPSASPAPASSPTPTPSPILHPSFTQL